MTRTRDRGFLGSACVPHVGERVLAIANFGLMFLTLADYRAPWEVRFGVTPKPDTARRVRYPDQLHARSYTGTLTRMKALLTLSLFIATAAFAQTSSPSAKHPFTFEDMMALKR